MSSFKELWAGKVITTFEIYFDEVDDLGEDLNEDYVNEWIDIFAQLLQASAVLTSGELFRFHAEQWDRASVRIFRLLVPFNFSDALADKFEAQLQTYMKEVELSFVYVKLNDVQLVFNNAEGPIKPSKSKTP